jgi:hypothetical protein
VAAGRVQLGVVVCFWKEGEGVSFLGGVGLGVGEVLEEEEEDLHFVTCTA